MSAPASSHAAQLAAWQKLWRILLADPPTPEQQAADDQAAAPAAAPAPDDRAENESAARP